MLQWIKVSQIIVHSQLPGSTGREDAFLFQLSLFMKTGKLQTISKGIFLYNHRLHAMLCKNRINSDTFNSLFHFFDMYDAVHVIYAACVNTHIVHIQEEMSHIRIGKDIKVRKMKIHV